MRRLTILENKIILKIVKSNSLIKLLIENLEVIVIRAMHINKKCLNKKKIRISLKFMIIPNKIKKF